VGETLLATLTMEFSSIPFFTKCNIFSAIVKPFFFKNATFDLVLVAF
jgi:hypothetical protein